MVGTPFSNWVKERVNARHAKIKEEEELGIEMDPEIGAKFKESQAISTSNGNSYNLCKASARRRRSKATLKESKRLESQRQSEIVTKLARIQEMEH